MLASIFMPLAGLPAYYLLGQNRLRGYERRRTKAEAKFFESMKLKMGEVAIDDVPQALRKGLNDFDHFNRFGAVFTPQTGEAELLIDGRETFTSIFEAINSAEKFIFVQYYILRSDRLGLELKELLVRKAKQGVAVFLLYDDWGSFWLKNTYIKDLRRAGVKTAPFLPVTGLTRALQFNFRNHRKFVAVDGKVAFTGGLNVGEEYTSRVFVSESKKKAYWRDTHIKITGSSALLSLDIFLEDWFFATGEILDEADVAHKLMDQLPPTKTEDLNSVIQYVPTGPTDPSPVSILFLMQLIQTAKKKLWIATPYFIPDPTLLAELRLATLRGVDVRLLMPKVGDNRFVHAVSLSFARKAEELGVEIYLYNKGFMHQKIVLVDDHMGAVGTMNFDNRAIWLNFETMVLVHSQTFAKKIGEMLESDFLHTEKLQLPKNTWGKHLDEFRTNLAGLMAPLM
jgi:cardiolipin synthase